MVDRKYEIKEHKVVEKTLVSERRYCDICRRYCDICSKEITGHFWDVITGHNDWGNDSYESIESFDVCSVECLGKVFDNYCKKSDSPYTTRYIEIEHKNSAEVTGEIKFEE